MSFEFCLFFDFFSLAVLSKNIGKSMGKKFRRFLLTSIFSCAENILSAPYRIDWLQKIVIIFLI